MKKATKKKNPPKLSLYAQGEGRNIVGGATGTLKKGKTTYSGNVTAGPGFKSADLSVNRQIKKNLNLGANVSSSGSYGANFSLTIPIGTKNKKKK